jgi:hypothetical protein
MTFKLPTSEEITACDDRLFARRMQERNDPSEELKLRRKVVSLEYWMGICEKTGINYIPARFSNPIPMSDMESALDGKEAPTLRTEIRKLRQMQINHMWRWDCCASMDVKEDMDKKGKHKTNKDVVIDDPRLWNILMDINQPEIKIATRPLIKPIYKDTHPVEFRVYLFEEGPPAISNYYPQIALDADWTHTIKQVLENAITLQEHSEIKDFSADFIISESREVIFLEGGPAWGKGARPCCFENNQEALKPGAIAFSLDRQTQTYSQKFKRSI